MIDGTLASRTPCTLYSPGGKRYLSLEAFLFFQMFVGEGWKIEVANGSQEHMLCSTSSSLG